MSKMQTLDVQTIPPPQRHPLIFDTLGQLDVDDVLEIKNDHDPKPLYYQLMAIMPGQFDWTYKEEGPEVWRVHIKRIAKA